MKTSSLADFPLRWKRVAPLSTQVSRRHRSRPKRTAVLWLCVASLLLPVSSSQTTNNPRYNVFSLPPFEISLDIDLWTTAVHGNFINHRRRGLAPALAGFGHETNSGPDPPNAPRERAVIAAHDPLDSLHSLKESLRPHASDMSPEESNLAEYVRALLNEYTTDYVTTFAHEAFRTKERGPKGWSVVHAVELRGELLEVDFYQSETNYLGPNGHYLRSRSLQRPPYAGPSLDGDLAPAPLSEAEETFATLILSFSGTAAILHGDNIDAGLVSATSSESLFHRPEIGKDELRIMLQGAFAPPDGPYQYLSLVLESAASDRQIDYAPSTMTHSDMMEHDAAILLGGSRQLKARTDLDLFPNAKFVGQNDRNPHPPPIPTSIYGDKISMEEAERRESITVFFQGLFLVFFLGGFYIYASSKYRQLHLRQQLHKYGDEDSILVRNISPDTVRNLVLSSSIRKPRGFRKRHNKRSSRAAQSHQTGLRSVSKLFGNAMHSLNNSRGVLILRRTNSHSPASTVDMDDEDGFFEREESGIYSSDEGMSDDEYNDIGRSLEYHETNSDTEDTKKLCSHTNSTKRKEDVNVVDTNNNDLHDNGSESDSSGTVQEEMRERSAPPSGGWGNVLDDVVPIPANDAVEGVDDDDATYHNGAKISASELNTSNSLLVQRRYVQPASPFDVLYGAAFLHGEADRVEAQRNKRIKEKQKIRSSPSARNRRKKKKKGSTLELLANAMNGQRSKDAIRPMMTIEEVEDLGANTSFSKCANEEALSEEGESDSDEEESLSAADDDFAKLGPGELRHNTSSMSFYAPSNFMRNLSEKYNLGIIESLSNTNTENQSKEVMQTSESHDREEDLVTMEDFPVEEGVVFRDFPRQDGTPCLIYNVVEQEVPSVPTVDKDDTSLDPSPISPLVASDDDNDAPHFIAGDENVLEGDNGNESVDLDDPDDHSDNPPDDFTAKLDRILHSKSRQIEERKQMEAERELRRKEREERRKNKGRD